MRYFIKGFKRMIPLVLLGFTLLTLVTPPLEAQTTPRIVSLAVFETMENQFNESILPRFYEQNPDITVNLVAIPSALSQDLLSPSASANLEDHLEAVAELVSSADVQLITPFTLSPESTRAGYFLDLKPLIDADTTLSPNDFPASVWQTYQWDSGFWALPTLVTPLVMAYDPAAFDALALSYPTESWTMDDYAAAARTLTTADRPGMMVSGLDLPRFFRMMSGQNFTDDAFPAHPDFTTSELAAVLETWHALEAEGAASSGFVQNAPLRFTRIYELVDRDLRAVLPHSQAGLDVFGLAISSGTNDVDAAYRLAAYLTSAPEMQTLMPEVLAARYSIRDSTASTLSADVLALRDQAVESAAPDSEAIFGNYLPQALALMTSGETATVALQTAQTDARNTFATAAALRETIQVNVPIATPAPAVSAGEVVVKFGLYTGSTSLPNRAQWERTIADFIAADGGIARIEFNFVAPVQGYWDEIPKNDCVFGYSFDGYSNEELFPLDPLLAADPTFDPNDAIGDVMLTAQRDGQTYGIPVAITPYVLRYNRELFAQAGLPEPDGTWTVDQFVDALQQLATVTEGAPLDPLGNSPTPWEMLAAAYGGVPIDYTTRPPTLHLADETVVPAIRQVLDLAKAGLIHYAPMGTFFGQRHQAKIPPAIIVDNLGFPTDLVYTDAASHGMVTFPVGVDFTPASYYTTYGFVFSHALYPEACYRWLREITRHPELFEGMPAYRSVINAPESQAVYGESGIATFNRFADLMDAPNSVLVNSGSLGNPGWIFMGRAFDRYVLEDADLEIELALAVQLTEDFRACTAEDGADWIDCLLTADPTIRENIEPRILGNR